MAVDIIKSFGENLIPEPEEPKKIKTAIAQVASTGEITFSGDNLIQEFLNTEGAVLTVDGNILFTTAATGYGVFIDTGGTNSRNSVLFFNNAGNISSLNWTRDAKIYLGDGNTDASTQLSLRFSRDSSTEFSWRGQTTSTATPTTQSYVIDGNTWGGSHSGTWTIARDQSSTIDTSATNLTFSLFLP